MTSFCSARESAALDSWARLVIADPGDVRDAANGARADAT